MLIGTTNQGLIFADVNKREDQFSVSFDEVDVVIATNELLEQRAKNLFDCVDDATITELLERFDCTLSELPKEYAYHYPYEGVLDCSLYPEIYFIPKVSDDDIVFESVGCGQHDPRTIESFRPIFPEFNKKLLSLWDNFHLKDIPQSEWEQLQKIKQEKYKDFNEEEYVEQWIINHYSDQ